jgi:uncharacterized membrane protein
MHTVLHRLLIAVAFIATALAWSQMPERVPVHWNMAGEVDRYGGRLEAGLLVPGMMLLVWGVMRFMPWIDPRRANYAAVADAYELVVSLVLGTMLAVHAVVLGHSVGYRIPMDTVIPLIVGAAFIGLGMVIPRSRASWGMEPGTSSTSSNDRVRERTHRVAGHAMVLAGAGFVVMAFVRDAWTRLAIIVVIGASVFIPLVYSYIIWRKETAD